MGVVSGNRSDEWLANELAGYVDAWAGAMTLSDCEYSIRVIKATMDNDDSVSEYGTSTVVGILVEVDDTTNNHYTVPERLEILAKFCGFLPDIYPFGVNDSAIWRF